MNKRPVIYWPACLYWVSSLTFIVLTRWLLKSQYLFHWDSVQFALALDHFDVTKHQPHPPGYIIYVGFGWLVNQLVHEPNATFIIVSIIFSLIGFWLVVKFARLLYGQTAGYLAGLIYLVNPAVWFHGLVAEVYIVDAVVGLAAVMMMYQYWRHHRWRDLVTAAVLLGFLGGIRQITEIILLPALGYLLWQNWKSLYPRRLGTVLAVLALTNLIWFVPLIMLSGGWQSYFDVVALLNKSVIVQSYRETGWATIASNLSLFWTSITQGLPLLVPAIVLAILPYFASESKKWYPIRYPIFWFWFWVLVPGAVILSLVLVRNPGYMMLHILVLIILLTGALQLIFNLFAHWQPRWRWGIMGGLVVVVTASQANTFLTLPADSYYYYSTSLSSVHDVNRLLQGTFQIVRNQFDPESSLIFIPLDVMIPGVRQFQYYLPEFNIYAYLPGLMKRAPGLPFWHVQGNTINEFVAQVPFAKSVKSVLIVGNQSNSDIYNYSQHIGDKSSYRMWKMDLTDPATRKFLSENKLFKVE